MVCVEVLDEVVVLEILVELVLVYNLCLVLEIFYHLEVLVEVVVLEVLVEVSLVVVSLVVVYE